MRTIITRRYKNMNAYQEPKYEIEIIDSYEDIPTARIINRRTRQPIPDDEPILILRAQDCYAAAVLSDYANRLPAGMHKEAVSCRAIQFSNWADEHPDRMKEPTTEITPDWTTSGQIDRP